MDERLNASLASSSQPPPPPFPVPTLSEREQVKIEFYRTYDVMTGVRIAATLGGFFSLMVILVLYKSKSKTEKALEDPSIAAAVAEAEEEERQLAAALEATAYSALNPRGARRSLGNASSPGGYNRNHRFMSVGGYSSLMAPPTRSNTRLPCFADEDSPPEEDRSLYDDVSTFTNRYLDVPRRSSNITCSSSDSSYLERRGSAVVLGLPAPPPQKPRGRRRQSTPMPEQWDFYYPIDIRVIQPTPGGSPCGSDRTLYDRIDPEGVKSRLAPLASISSCASSLAADYPDLESRSFASDSVFFDDDEECEDTDDEIGDFSTDSDSSSDRCTWSRRSCTRPRAHRSESQERLRPLSGERPPCPLPPRSERSSLASLTVAGSSAGSPALTMPTFPLSDRRSSMDVEEGTWSQETLF